MMLGDTRKASLQFLLRYIVVLLVCANTCVVGLALSSADAGIECIEKERHALLMIKKDLVDEFGHLSSWGDEEGQKDCCNWRWIKCNNQTRHVTTLDLRVSASFWWEGSDYEPLRGKISPSLLELQHLTYLDLSYNDFGGSHIPDFIGSLTKLRYLSLSYAEFGGTIPYQLGNLSSLHSLFLGFNAKLRSESLNWVSKLSSLRYLDMSYVNLEKAVDWIQTVHMLPSIVDLRLSWCKLSSTNIPPTNLSLFNLSTSLISLDLSHNSLTSTIYRWLFDFAGNSLWQLSLFDNQLVGPIPDAFENMTSLEHLHLSRNQIEGGIPKSLGNMLNIRTLEVSDNNLYGNFPEIVRNLSGHAMNTLESLHLGENMISGSIPDVTIFSSLKDLYLLSNNLNGSLPSRFEHPCNLENLELSDNQITGSLPDDLSVYSSLRWLNLDNNQINGSLPESIGKLSNLQFLGVSSNQLQGTVSEAHFSNLTELMKLDLSDNHLSLGFSSKWLPPFQLKFLSLRSCKLGTRFPVWLRNQKNLSSLDISNNQISDVIPNWFWGSHYYNLRVLDLSHNHIKGILPDLSSTFPDLRTIDLSSNHLEGSLPIFPSNTTSVKLSNNMFSGPISVICAIMGRALKHFDLSHNLLSGQLPDCWWQWEELKVLNLANNNFSGKIPSSMGSLRSIQSLHLRKNNLVGELPSSLQNCTTIITLDVGENKLSGKLPTWIGEKLSGLVILILRSNEFYGIIPIQLCYLEYVQLFDISQNSITGIIPGCFNNFTAIARNWTFSKTIEQRYATYSMLEGHLKLTMMESYVDNALVAWKGRIFEYDNTLGLVKSIDLSSNKLMGEIPLGITNLSGLLSLNLSRNNLIGSIPLNIGQLRSLESLDLSRNQLFGEIPGSISDLNFLSFLDLSSNNLSGKIPLGTQLQRFEASSFAGNPALYGPPLTQKCPGDYTCQGPLTTGGGGGGGGGEDADTQKDEDIWFYASIALGFIVGFWGVCGTLVLHRSWRFAYFRLFDKFNDWLYVKKAVHTASFKRKFRAGLDRFH